MKSLTINILIVLFLGVCEVSLFAQKKGKLTPEEKNNLKSSKVLIYRYEAPPLSFMTPKDAVGAGLVADITKSDEAKAQERHRFYPAALVQKHIDSLLKANDLMSQVELVEEAFEFHMPADLKDLSKYQGVDADYIIEIIVPLMGWRASYSPTKWKTYWLNLAVETRIIRKSDLTRIWKTNVGHGGLKDKRMKFHISEMEENGQEKIAEMLKLAALESSHRVIEKYLAAKK